MRRAVIGSRFAARFAGKSPKIRPMPAATTKDKQTVVVISNKEYRKMQQPKESLVDFFQNSPLKNADLNLDRDKSTT